MCTLRVDAGNSSLVLRAATFTFGWSDVLMIDGFTGR
jgi:hypothetical protein